MAAFQDVSQNPQNISKYQNNPKVKKVIDKLSSKFGGTGAGAGAGPGAGASGGTNPPPQPPPASSASAGGAAFDVPDID